MEIQHAYPEAYAETNGHKGMAQKYIDKILSIRLFSSTLNDACIKY